MLNSMGMVRSYIEYKGVIYPTIRIELNKVSDIDSDVMITLADCELWFGIEDDYEEGISEAIDIDNGVYYYCDCGFIGSCPTEGEVISYMSDK